MYQYILFGLHISKEQLAPLFVGFYPNVYYAIIAGRAMDESHVINGNM